MIDFYISKKDIKKAMPETSNYLVNKSWKKVRDYCEKENIPLFDRSTVPTQVFCEFMKIDRELLLSKMRGDETNEK